MSTSRPASRNANVAREPDDPFVTAALLTLLLKIALLVVVFDPRAADAFALPKSAVTHGLSFVLVALLLWCYLRGRIVVPRRATWAPVIAAVVYLVVMASATVFASDSTVALYGISRRYLGLTHVADCVLIYLAAVLLIRGGRDLARLLFMVSVSSAIAIIYAVAQSLGLDPMTYQGSTLRPISTFGQPDIAGAYFSLLAVTAMGIAIWFGAGLARSSAERTAALILGVLAVVAGYVALLTGVRSVALSALGGWVALLIALVCAKPPRRPLAGALAAAGIAAAVLFALSPAAYRLSPQFLATDPSTLGRVEMWLTASKIIDAHPILGVGPDNFGVAYPALRDVRSLTINGVGVLQNSTHSWPFYVLTSGGALAAIVILFFLATSVLLGLRLARRRALEAAAVVPLVAYLGQSLVNVNDLGLDWIIWLSAGVIASAVARNDATSRSRGLTSPSRNWIGAAAVLASVVVAVYTTFPRIEASETLGRTQVFASAGRPSDAVDEARHAVVLDGRRPEYWAGFGVALQTSGGTGAAAVAFKDAVDRAPWDPIYWRQLAATRSVSGDMAGGIIATKGALRADPFDVESRNLLSRLLYNRGDYGGALQEGERALAILPTDSRAYEAPIRAALALQQWPAAEALSRSGLQRFPTSPGIRILLARVLLATGRIDEARATIDAALSTDPQNVEALQVKAMVDAR